MKKFLVACSALALLLPFQANAQSDPGTSSLSLPTPGAEKTSFQELDLDGNGELSTDEIMANVQNDFDEKDSNADGYLSPAEFQNVARMESSEDENVDLEREQRRAAMQVRRFERLDEDKDGFLSRGEMLANARKQIEKLDENNDGNIILGEMKLKMRDTAKEKGHPGASSHGDPQNEFDAPPGAAKASAKSKKPASAGSGPG